MKVLVACEFSGIVRDAFIARGHDAMSCDLLPTERPGPHFQGDCRFDAMAGNWDLIIAHPPCTHLAVSGARWWREKREEQREAIEFFLFFTTLPCEKIAIENPISIMSTVYRKPDQVIQPWMFGHGETKATCLWLKNLPKLQATHRKNDLFCQEEPRERVARVHREAPGPDRWKNRSRTYQDIADAMAAQWGKQL